eukprot:6145450-Karenia_brevis.AAC.1
MATPTSPLSSTSFMLCRFLEDSTARWTKYVDTQTRVEYTFAQTVWQQSALWRKSAWFIMSILSPL